MKLVIANDHAAIDLKNGLIKLLKEYGHDVVNLGTDTPESVDYPLFAKKASEKILSGEVDAGILLCGTGIGMSIAANKIHGIRACACTEEFSARFSKKHNNTNVLCMGGRLLAAPLAYDITEKWMNEKYEGGRHQKRLDEVHDLEKNY